MKPREFLHLSLRNFGRANHIIYRFKGGRERYFGSSISTAFGFLRLYYAPSGFFVLVFSVTTVIY